MVTVRIVPKMENTAKEILVEGNTVEDVISKLYNDHNIPKKKYNKHLKKRVSTLRGRTVFKKSPFENVGHFDEEGYKPKESSNQKVKDGDTLLLMFAVAGG